MGEEAPVTHILDAGPLIAALKRGDRYHRWSRDTLQRLGPPFLSRPEAMAEAAAMTGRPAAIVEMIHAGNIVLGFDLAAQASSVLALLKQYADREIDLVDACIVRMTELTRDCRVVTLDRADFAVYRRHGRVGTARAEHRTLAPAVRATGPPPSRDARLGEAPDHQYRPARRQSGVPARRA